MTPLGLKPLVVMQIMIMLVLLTLAGVSLYAIQTLSSAATAMGQGKDLVADILPPPLYVIEAQLVSQELLLNSRAQRAALLDKLHTLKKDFDQRNQYWAASKLDAQLKRLLLGKQRQHADLFWRAVTTRFIPAIQAGDMAAARAILLEMHGYYAAHRHAVDETVRVANQYARDTQNTLFHTSQRTKWLLALVASLSCLGVLGIAIPSLNRLYRDLHESEARFHAIFAQAAVGVALIETVSGCFLRINQRYCDIVGYTPEEMGQITVQALTHPDDLNAELIQLRLLSEGKINAFSIEKRLLHKNGSEVWVESTASPLRLSGDIPSTYITVVQDIADRKHKEVKIHELNLELEKRVSERTTELAGKNRELETFTYSVSHDLKAPLRGIDGYSRLLLEDHAAQLDEEGRTFLANIRRGAGQMGQLIEDLLAYSRIERRHLQAEQVDLPRLVDTTVAERAEEIAARGVTMKIDVFPQVVIADRDGLAMALRNLLDNALKFTRDAPQPVIEIGLHLESGICVLWVRDNGIGFDMKFHERIFEIFQRLQLAEEFPGTGIGLAIVRKAMQRMGGRAWAASTPGQGATFYLEMPL